MLFKTFSRAFVVVSVCAFFTASASASKPAAYLSRESLERRIAEGAAAGAKLLKQFDVRRAPHTHSRRQVSIVPADRQAVPTPEANRHLVVLAVTSPVHTADMAMKTGSSVARRQTQVLQNGLGFGNDNPVVGYVEDIKEDFIKGSTSKLQALDNAVFLRQAEDQADDSTSVEDIEDVEKVEVEDEDEDVEDAVVGQVEAETDPTTDEDVVFDEADAAELAF